MKNDNEIKRGSVVRVLNIMSALVCGGMETTVMNYYRHIDRSKIQFDFLITIDGKNYYEDEAISLGARIFRRPMRTKDPIGNMLGLTRVLRNNADIKIIHIHNFTSVVAIDAVLAIIYGVKTRIVYSSSDIRANAPFIHRVFQPLLRTAATHWMAGSTVAGISMFGEKAVSRLLLLPRARELESYKYDPERRDATRKRLHLQEQLAIVHVARFDKAKNQIFLLKAFSCALKKNKGMVLLLAGDGELMPKLKKIVGGNDLTDYVRFLGQRDDIPDLLNAADMFVLPSLHEGLPGAAIEAQAAGLPCLLSDTISPECNVTDLVEFLPIDKGPEIWAERMLEDKRASRMDTSEEIRKAGYDICDAAKWLESIYTSALER